MDIRLQCIARSAGQAEDIVRRLLRAGVRRAEIAMAASAAPAGPRRPQRVDSFPWLVGGGLLGWLLGGCGIALPGIEHLFAGPQDLAVLAPLAGAFLGGLCGLGLAGLAGTAAEDPGTKASDGPVRIVVHLSDHRRADPIVEILRKAGQGRWVAGGGQDRRFCFAVPRAQDAPPRPQRAGKGYRAGQLGRAWAGSEARGRARAGDCTATLAG